MNTTRLGYAPVLAALVAIVVVTAASTVRADAPDCTSSSVYNSDYPTGFAIDGNLKTRWASKPLGKATFTVDFGKVFEVNSVKIHWERACSADYQIQMSNDGKQWTTLSHQQDGKAKVEVVKGLKGKGRYFRINSLAAKTPFQHISIWEISFDNPALAKVLKKAAETSLASRFPSIPPEVAHAKLAEHGVKEIVFSTRADSNDGHWYANLGYWSFDENDMLYGKGGRLCKLNVETGKYTVLISDPEGTIRDPVVHYDAEKILFSWRKADSRVFHLYECDLNGGQIRQITNGKYDDIEPCYLPDGDIVFVSGRGKRYVNCWLTQVAILYRCDADGGNIQQLSANIEQDNTPWVLADGRIIYQRWEYIDRSQVSFHHLWSMYPDGTNQTVYFGNMYPGGLYIDAKPIPGTEKVVFINSPGHGRREHSGDIAIVSDRRGPDNREALRNLTNDPQYRDPWPLSADLFLAAKGKKIVVLNGEGALASIFELPDEFGSDVFLQEPRPVIKRQRERIIPSRTDPSQATGRLVLQDVHVGRNMEGINRGDIKKLLVLESLPKPINFTGGMDPLTYGGSFTLERVIGTVPVEEDGSAYMELPANRSLFFVALDKNDNSVKRMQSFLSVMPGEVQGCVGCHENRKTAPVSSLSYVNGDLLALKRAPSQPEPIADIPDVFDFPRDIQPILDEHCVTCHRPDWREGGVVLTGDRGPMFSLSYVMLTLKQQFADGRNLPQSNYAPRALGTSASPLMKKISGEHQDVKLTPKERNIIRYWIETGSPYPGTYAALGHGSIGGYQKNQLIHIDTDWPTAKAFAQTVEQRCAGCHQRELGLPTPKSLSDEIGISFWRFDMNDKRLKFSRHLMFNLTRPELSHFLLAPLSKEAGGLELCKGFAFQDTNDSDYQALLTHITAGKKYLETTLTRFDMPQFMPRREYFREMKKYGILPETFDPAKDPFDVYQLDRKYWQSLWYHPRSASAGMQGE